MKKIFLIAVVILLGMGVQAQWFVGGQFNFDLTQKSNDDGEKISTDFKFGISPIIGYCLTDALDFGVEFGIGINSSKSHYSNTTNTTTNWQIAPFLRYCFLEVGDFRVLGKFAVGAEGETNRLSIGLRALPVLSYALTEHIDLIANLNFASFGLYYEKQKSSTATTGFGMGFDSNNVANIGGLTVGFLYKF